MRRSGEAKGMGIAQTPQRRWIHSRLLQPYTSATSTFKLALTHTPKLLFPCADSALPLRIAAHFDIDIRLYKEQGESLGEGFEVGEVQAIAILGAAQEQGNSD